MDQYFGIMQYTKLLIFRQSHASYDRCFVNWTEDVIYRCWERTGILPDELEDIIDEPLDNEIEIEDEIVQSLIDQMIVDNAVIRAEEY